MFLHLLQAAFLGTVQGFTEYLPISSTAHLIIFERLFHLDPQAYGLSFDMFTNIGTLVAIIIYFRQDLLRLIRSTYIPGRSAQLTSESALPWVILLATIPAGLAGALAEKKIDSSLRTFPVIAASLILVGVLMLVADTYSKQKKARSVSLTPPILWMGCAQAIALIPGISRSGATITTGIFSGLRREEAARYSFLLSIPITVAAITKRLAEFASTSLTQGISSEVALFYGVGLLFSTVVGFWTVSVFLKYIRQHGLAPFAYYRFLLAAILIFYR